MKKLLITASLLLASLGASAQFHADLRVGATASSIGDQHLKIGIRAGAGVEYLFTERWGLRSGLFFSMKGATTSNNVFNYDADKATRALLSRPSRRGPRFVPPLAALGGWLCTEALTSPACSMRPCPTAPVSTFAAGRSGPVSARISSSGISSSAPKFNTG